MRIHDGLGALRDQQRLSVWLRRVARNVLVDHWRRTASRREVTGTEVDVASDPPAEAASEELADCLGAMVETLPPGQREAVELSELAGVRQREVARRLGLSLSGAKSRIQRGREGLRDRILRCCHVELDVSGRVRDYEPRKQPCCGR